MLTSFRFIKSRERGDIGILLLDLSLVPRAIPLDVSSLLFSAMVAIIAIQSKRF